MAAFKNSTSDLQHKIHCMLAAYAGCLNIERNEENANKDCLTPTQLLLLLLDDYWHYLQKRMSANKRSECSPSLRAGCRAGCRPYARQSVLIQIKLYTT